jgi:hypothetical protein
MLRSDDVGCGAYGSGWVRRWTLVGGWPRCVEAPLAVTAAAPAALAAQVAVNRALAALLARAEHYEAAARLAAACTDQPPAATLPVPDGEPVPSPAWEAWQAAQALVAGADADLLWLVRTRAGALATGEAGYALDLPPLPPIGDPCRHTADWVAGAWVVRPLAPAEQQDWPLRRRPDLGKLAFAQLLITLLGDAKAQALLTAFGPTLSLAADIDFDDVFGGPQGGPAYADQLLADGSVTADDVARLRLAWPLAGGAGG